LATKLIHQPDELAGVSIADSAIGLAPNRTHFGVSERLGDSRG